MLENADDIFVALTYEEEYKAQDEAYKKLFEENDTVFIAFMKGCLVSPQDIKEKNPSNDSESSQDVYVTGSAKKANADETKLLHGEEDMLRFFEEKYDFSAEFCTIESTHTEPCEVMLYKLTRN